MMLKEQRPPPGTWAVQVFPPGTWARQGFLILFPTKYGVGANLPSGQHLNPLSCLSGRARNFWFPGSTPLVGTAQEPLILHPWP